MKFGYCDPTNYVAKIRLLDEHDEQNELGVDIMGVIGSATRHGILKKLLMMKINTQP